MKAIVNLAKDIVPGALLLGLEEEGKPSLADRVTAANILVKDVQLLLRQYVCTPLLHT